MKRRREKHERNKMVENVRKPKEVRHVSFYSDSTLTKLLIWDRGIHSKIISRLPQLDNGHYITI